MSTAKGTTIVYSKQNKKKLMRCFLNYLKHAENCLRGKVKDPVKDSYGTDLCQLQFCMYVDLVISHKMLMDCKSGDSCNIAGCFSSSKTFLHCKDCCDSNCFVCNFVKRGNKNSSTNGSITTSEKDVKVKGARFPGGLIIDQINSTATLGTKDWHSSFGFKDRNKQISGFFRTIISTTDSSLYLDRKLFYFLACATHLEKAAYEEADSKEGYITVLLESIKQINEEFLIYREEEEEFSTVKNAAEEFFKGKMVQLSLNALMQYLPPQQVLPQQESETLLTNQLEPVVPGPSSEVQSNVESEVAPGGADPTVCVELFSALIGVYQILKLLKAPKELQKALEAFNTLITDFKESLIRQNASNEMQQASSPKLNVQIFKFIDNKLYVELPTGLTYTLGEPKSLEGSAKLWQKTVNLSDREDVIFKLYEANFPGHDFPEGLISSLIKYTTWEEKFFNTCTSKASYFKTFNDYIRSTKKLKSSGKQQSINEVAGLPSNASAKKKSKTKSKKSDQSHLNRSTKSSDYKNLESSSNDKISDIGTLCYSHYLLLTCSVSYQLWKKSEQESVAKPVLFKKIFSFFFLRKVCNESWV